jgi:hypothetical protein
MDIFVLKLNSSGTYQWHTFYGAGNFFSDSGQAVAVDPDGSAYVTGYANANWPGDGGAPPRHAFSGNYDFVVLKLDKDGRYQWHTFYGSAEFDIGFGILFGRDRGVYVAGYSWNWLGDNGAAPLHPNGGGRDFTLLALSENGDYQWHTFYGGTGNDEAHALAEGPLESLVLAGHSGGNWKGDGNANPLHPFPGSITVLKMGSKTRVGLPIVIR